ncbi:MAG: hypothetical protein ACK4JB_20110 [Reyranella sp.]
MSRLRNWILLGPAVALMGLMLVVTFAPRAGRAAQEALVEPDRSPPTHQLWSCTGKTTCKPHGEPLGKTACQLDAASLANTLPAGSKVACQRVKQ